jgi:hypothetical protein
MELATLYRTAVLVASMLPSYSLAGTAWAQTVWTVSRKLDCAARLLRKHVRVSVLEVATVDRLRASYHGQFAVAVELF